MLLIAGTGRDSGKTLLACNIIRLFCKRTPVISCKICRHAHHIDASGKVIADEDNLYIAEEEDPGTGKDSSRLLEAGAARSFYVVATDDQLIRATEMIMGLAGNNAYYIFESGGLRQFVTPGLFIMMSRAENIEKKADLLGLECLADIRVTFNGNQFDFDINSITINENRWQLTI